MNVVSLYQLIYVHPPPLHTTKWFNSIWLRNIPTWLYHKYAIVLSLYIWLLKLFCEFNFDIKSLYFWKMLPKYLTFFHCCSTVIILCILLLLFWIYWRCLTVINYICYNLHCKCATFLGAMKHSFEICLL